MHDFLVIFALKLRFTNVTAKAQLFDDNFFSPNLVLVLLDKAVEIHSGCDSFPGNRAIFHQGELEYDKDGVIGAKGKVDQAVVDEVLKQPFSVHNLPKTTGREISGGGMGEDICEQMLK